MRILPENEPSNAVALRLGASFDGLQPNKIAYKGEAKMANYYSLLPEAPHSEVYANQTQTQTKRLARRLHKSPVLSNHPK